MKQDFTWVVAGGSDGVTRKERDATRASLSNKTNAYIFDLMA